MSTDPQKAAKTPARPTLKAVRGTRDLLPDQTPLWNHVEATARKIFTRYNFGEIRTPIFEDTSLFSRAVGEETDIVGKEMFTWQDGERFDIEEMEDAWWRVDAEYQDREYGMRGDKYGINAIRHLTDHVELLMFRGRLDQLDLSNLEDAIAIAKSNFHSYSIRWTKDIRGRVVVASPIPGRAAEKRNEAITVDFLHGNFTKSSQSLTLRPENTAGVVRAVIEHKLIETGNLQKLYYIGPQFRRERPQRGRYRQFWQIGAEVIGPPTSGSESPLRDAEILEMLATLLDELGIRGWRLDLNSVGNAEDRARYNAALREALAPIKDQLCPDNQRRADTNPLRVLDSKDEQDQVLIDALPKIADYLGPDSKSHFEAVLAALDAAGVAYNLNPRLVRGLDYYTRTTFEFTVTTGLGTQNALLGGGRYDGLSEMLGGPRAPGIGFAIGEDRLILTLQAQADEDRVAHSSQSHRDEWGTQKLDVYIAPLGPAQNPAALKLARDLRREGLTAEVGDGTHKIRKHFDTADKLARHIILLGEDEAATNILTVKTFATGEQKKIPLSELRAAL